MESTGLVLFQLTLIAFLPVMLSAGIYLLNREVPSISPSMWD